MALSHSEIPSAPLCVAFQGPRLVRVKSKPILGLLQIFGTNSRVWRQRLEVGWFVVHLCSFIVENPVFPSQKRQGLRSSRVSGRPGGMALIRKWRGTNWWVVTFFSGFAKQTNGPQVSVPSEIEVFFLVQIRTFPENKGMASWWSVRSSVRRLRRLASWSTAEALKIVESGSVKQCPGRERARCDQTTDRKRVCSAAKDSGVLLGITNEKLRPPFVLTILDLFLQRITVSPNISYLNIPRHSHISEKWRSHRFDSEDLWWPTVTYGFVSQFERSCRICRRMVEHGRNLDGPWIDGEPDQDRSR